MVLMNWSLYKDTENVHFDKWEENPAAWFIDEDAIASGTPPLNAIRFLNDGVHKVYFFRESVELTVTDGKWDIVDALRKIGVMVGKTGYHGRYIEQFILEDKKLRVVIGS